MPAEGTEPGFCDLQVNGYAGIDFGDDTLTPERFHQACAALQRDGVSRFQPTIITGPLPQMCAQLRRVAACTEADALASRMVVGLHAEGPFLNPDEGYRGAHRSAFVRPANGDDAAALVDAGQGRLTMLTLAPEVDAGLQVTRRLADRGITVSAGHTNADLDTLRAAVDAGLSCFTHLGNGCPNRLPRHDNIVQRVLSMHDDLWIAFIADGAHVPFFALRNYLAAAGPEKTIVVTDAMPAAGKGPGAYRFDGRHVTVGEDLVARNPDGNTLFGSAMTMRRAVANLVDAVGLSRADAQRLTVTNPAALLGL